MAEKGEGPCHQNLVCPLCLDIFDNATLLTCGHTFCKKCLKKYDDSHSGLDHMVCPLCRSLTELQENRVDGLPSNVSINGLVDEFFSSTGGMNALLEVQPKCVCCEADENAAAFCVDCDMYMCADCTQGHRKMILFFKGHQIISLFDIHNGRVSIDKQFDRCPVHKQEKKDLFCEQCTLHICLKCVVVDHRDHKIKNQQDFVNEMKIKFDDLVQRFKSRKAHIERNIQNIEVQRQEVHSAVQKMETEIRKSYNKKAKQLKEHETCLLEELKSLPKGFDEELDYVKTRHRQRIKHMSSSLTLVTNNRLGSLEAGSLTAHTLVCSELDDLLKEDIDEKSPGHVKENARNVRFHAADDEVLILGKLEFGSRKHSQLDLESFEGAAAGVNDRSKIEGMNSTDKGSTHSAIQITQSLPPSLVMKTSLTGVRVVDLPASMIGMTPLSHDTVVIGYGCSRVGADSISVTGERKSYLREDVGAVWKIAILTDGRSVISDYPDKLRICNADGSLTDITLHCKGAEDVHSLCSNQENDIYVVNGNSEIYIYHIDNPQPYRVIPTGNNNPIQICVTKTGTMITSTCHTTHSMVTVYDKEGHEGTSIQSTGGGEYLCAAVDSQDRVFVARMKHGSYMAALSVYELEGAHLIEKVKFEELRLPFTFSVYTPWCQLACLSPTLLALALAYSRKLYFIQISSYSSGL